MIHSFKLPPEQVLRPYTNISSLRVWDYYVEENLYGGPSFDRELFEAATNEDNEQPLEQSDRRTVNASYDDVAHAELDIHRWLLEVCLFVFGSVHGQGWIQDFRIEGAQKTCSSTHHVTSAKHRIPLIRPGP